jgi:hypothetical protein
MSRRNQQQNRPDSGSGRSISQTEPENIPTLISTDGQIVLTSQEKSICFRIKMNRIAKMF